jgi:RNA polymerase sigma-70 factor (ECF subfamily)
MKTLVRLLFARPRLTDEEAMVLVQTSGDHEAFAQLVQRWQQPIRRLCIRMAGEEHRGHDLAQETFARVYSERSGYAPGRKFSTWLWRIAVNLCHDDYRRVGRRAEVSLETTAAEQTVADDPAPDQQLLKRERSELVRDAVLSLPEEQRAVLILREYEGLKFREIAEVLGVPEGTLKWRMSEALGELGRRLKPHFATPAPSPKPLPATIRERFVL